MENNKNIFRSENNSIERESFVGELEQVDRSRQDDYEKFEQEKNEALRLAYTDEQTGCYNRNYYEKITKITEYEKHKSDIIFILVDVNNLSLVNNEQSYGAGDRLIGHMVVQLRNQLSTSPIAKQINGNELGRGDTIIVRLGGDEFAVLRLKTEEEKNDTEFETNFEEATDKNIYDNAPKSLDFAWGFAVFDKDFDEDLHGTKDRAGMIMHQRKRIMKGIENK
ncbi:MAG: GGDEF domain-containing protein [Candidatus Saccharibacteria bacterium]